MAIDKSKEEVIRRFLLLGAACCAFLFLYLPMVHNWFFKDDLQWIWSSSNASWKEIFFVPQVARGMAPFFTPMLAASFKIDWILFGINPMGYSVHSLISLAAVTIALYLFIRLYTTKNMALIGVSLLLLNPSTIAITSWFSARHYLEGLFFAVLSLYFFVKAERKGEVSVASGIFYLIASLNKELYVVLPAIAFLVSGEGLIRRVKNTIPLWLGLFIYALWRYAIMREMGGYTMMQSINLKPAFLYQIIKLFSVHWFGDYYALGYLFLFAAFLFSLKDIRMFLIFLVLLIPILPLGVKLEGGYYSGRYFFHMSAFMICAICLFVQYRTFGNKLFYRIAPFVVILFIAALFVKQDIQISPLIKEERSKAREEATALLNSDKPYVKSDLFLTGFYNAFRNIYHNYFGKDIKTRPVPPEDSLRYCSPERLREIAAAGIDIPYNEILTMQKKLRTGPVSIKITLDNYKLAWDLGPDKHGTYVFLPGPLPGLYYGKSTFPPTGSLMIGRNPGGEVETIYFRILHDETGDREEVISPEFVIRFPGTQTIEYHSE